MNSDNNNGQGFQDLSEAINVFAAAIGGLVIANPQLTTKFPGLQYLPAMILDGFGGLAAEATPDDPTKGMPQDIAEAVMGFLGAASGTAAATYLAPIALAGAAAAGLTITPLWAAIFGALAVYVISDAFAEVFKDLVEFAFWLPDSPLINLIRDPLILDLDGDGVELTSLAGSATHFDYDQDGFAEKTGWVNADDGILVRDGNINDIVDGASELFGSPNQDGFAVLEAMDTNGDGTIDANDEGFDQLRVWQDLDQDGISDAGELRTLSEAGIKSISVIRSDIGGTNQGHPIGYEASFERSDGTSGTAQTIYFETDRQNTVSDNTPGFTPSTEATQLPQLQGSGQINSIAWMVTTDLAFRDAWTELTDNAATLSFDELRGNFVELLLRWADVDDVAEAGRGKFVNGQHLAFVEKFFGTTYREIYSGDVSATSPTTPAFGGNIEASFNQIVDALLTAFLAQTSTSAVLRGADVADVIASPYFAYTLLNLSADEDGGPPSVEASHGSVKAALSLIAALMPDEPGAAAKYLQAGLNGLGGVISLIFDGNRTAFLITATDALNAIDDPVLRSIATEIIKGTALVGSSGIDGLSHDEGDNIFMGGRGDDVIVSGDGSDLFVYASGDGSDYIRDTSVSTTEDDQLFLTDLLLTDLVFERVGNALIIKFASSEEKIISEDFFRDWGAKDRGLDSIRLSDGTILTREQIRELTTTAGDGRNNSISDTALNDVLRGGQGDDEINISGGSDTVVYAKGDGDDVIRAGSDSDTDFDTLFLAGLRSTDVELSRVGNALIIGINSTEEFLTDADFFRTSTGLAGKGIDRIQFSDGITWHRDAIRDAAWIRGSGNVDWLNGFTTSDVFVGGAGADTLQGQLGSDTYRWSKGDGNDTVVESADVASQDRLFLLDVKPGEVELMRRGTSLLVSIKSTGEVLEIARQFESIDNVLEDWNARSYGLEVIEFGNGVQWSRQYLMANIVNVGFDLDISYWFQLSGSQEPPFPVGNVSEAPGGGGGSTLPLLGITFEDELGHTGNFYDIEEIVRNYERLDRGGNDIFLGDEHDERIGGGYYNSASEDGPPTGGTMQGSTGSGGGSGGGADLTPSWPIEVINSGHNHFDGRGGNDTIIGGAGHDSIIGGDGNDDLYGDQENLVGSGAGGQDIIDGGNGNDLLSGGAGSDYLAGGEGEDKLYGGNHSDVLFDKSAAIDEFVGGKGDDIILSGNGVGGTQSLNGNDFVHYSLGDGNDLIYDGSTSLQEIDRLRLLDVDPSEVELSRSGSNLVIRFLQTGETITDYDHFRASYEGIGIDEIEFGDGTIWDREILRELAWIRGSDQRELLQVVDAGRNTFISNRGDDIVLAAAARGSANDGRDNGNDRYIYQRGDGNDVIFDGSHSATEIDRLILVNINHNEVQLSRYGNHLEIKDIITGQIIVNEGFFWNWETRGQGVDEIEFLDGTVWGRSELMENAWAWGSVTDDLLIANDIYANTFVGGLGDDILQSASVRGGANGGGANGNDRFLYNLGDGNDLIFDGSHFLSETDRLVLNGINAEDVALSMSGIDLIIKIKTTGHIIIDEGAFWNRATTGQGLDEIEFDNGLVWSREDIRYWAQEGSIFFAGTTSDDNLIGSHFDQRLGGGNGNDFIDGGAGSDKVFGDAGNDTLAISTSGSDEVDELDGGTGVDTVSFSQFGSSVHVDLALNNGEARSSGNTGPSASTDRVVAKIINLENVLGTAHQDGIFGNDAANMLSGGNGDDVLDGRSGNDVLDGGNGNDRLVGYIGTDTLTGGAGNDQLEGGLDNDIYVFQAGDGEDVIQEIANGGVNDIIRLSGIGPSDVKFVRSGSNVVLQLSGGTSVTITLIGSSGSTLHYDQFGIEGVQFSNGTNWDAHYLRQWSVYDTATDGNDTLVGSEASGLFGGGRGNDQLNAGAGNDTYIYVRGDGDDTIVETTNAYGAADQLVFTDVNPSDVTWVRNGTDLTIAIAESSLGAGDAGSVLIKDTLNDKSDRGIEKVVFADGTAWTRAQIRVLLLQQAATDGNDTITGFNVADTIAGGGGADTLSGGEASDTYIYARGDGNDIIMETTNSYGAADQLVLADLTPADVTLVRNGTDLTLAITESAPGAGNSGSILIKDTLDDNSERGVEKIVFADGTTWTRAQIRELLLQETATDGNDTISGFNIADTIAGGGGADILSGGAANDTYIYARGDGHDTIVETTNSHGSADQLVFTDLNPADVTLVRNGTDLTIAIAESTSGADDSGSILIKDTLADNRERGVEKIVFADGTTWSRADMIARLAYVAGTEGDDTITGTTGADSDIRAGRGNDTLSGLAGSDTYAYTLGDGNDTITEVTSGADADTLAFADINLSSIRFERSSGNANDVNIRILQSNQIITLKDQFIQAGGIERISFEDGTSIGGNDWSLDAYLKANAAVYGTNGHDVLGTSSNPFKISDTTIDLGLGDDSVYADRVGADTVVYRSGDGNDTYRFWNSSISTSTLNLLNLSITAVQFSRTEKDLLIADETTGQIITITDHFVSGNHGFANIQFSDGSLWDRSRIQAEAIFRGTSGNDVFGTSAKPFNISNVTIDLGLGDDSTYVDRAAADTVIYRSGDGNDTYRIWNSSASTSILKLVDLDASDVSLGRNGSRLLITDETTGQIISITSHFESSSYGFGSIQFSDGSGWDRPTMNSAVSYVGGTNGNDVISGTSSSETIRAGLGDDTITGAGGSDAIIFKPNFGRDVITDFAAGSGTGDILEFSSNLFADFEAVLAAASQVGSDTLIAFDATNTITLKNLSLTNLSEDDVRFVA